MNAALSIFESVTASGADPSRAPGFHADSAARLRWKRALEHLHTHRGHPFAEIDRLLAAQPGCVPAHWLRAALIVAGDEAARRSALAVSLAVIEAAHPDARDRMHRHAAAARAWLDGDSNLALERYGAIAARDPHDIVALVVAHALDFRLGRQRMLRDRIARALTRWNESMPGYASVLAKIGRASCRERVYVLV